MESLFDEMGLRSGLAPIIRMAALKRALARAGLQPDELTPTSLRTALSEIHSTLRVYLDDVEALARLRTIETLAASTEDDG